MNFSPELSAFQGAILSTDNVHQFSRLSAKGGNEEQINYVIVSLSRFLEESQLICDGKILNIVEVRKLALYIVLNADLPELQQLVEMESISTVIWTTPTIPKCLMCEIMWNTHMEQFISEIISFAQPQLALEVASAFLDNFKYFNPLSCLDQLKLLTTSSYLLICRLHFFCFESPGIIQKSTAALNNFVQCLKYYTTPPNNHKLNTLNKANLYKYQGKSLYSLLHVMEDCLNTFTKRLDVKTPGDDFYKLTYAEESLKKDLTHVSICNSPINVLLESINNANIAMLDVCKTLVMDVSVDVFCCWSEIEENGKTMQQTVGELCYKVHNKLISLPTLADHPVVSMFEQIARKPVEMKDKINATDDDVIERNINNNNDDSRKWIKALIHREKLCQNMKLLNIVASNLDLYNKDESYILYANLSKNSLDMENRDFIDALSVKVFENCFTVDKYTILQERFSDKTFFDMKETLDFERDLTLIFNQLIASPEADCHQVFKLFLQSPQKLFTKVFLLACENLQQTEIMLRVMKLFEAFADHYYNTDTESCLMRIAQQRIERRFENHTIESNFVNFICGLKNENIVSGTKLFLLIIMTNIHKVLLNKEILDLKVQIKLLKEAYKLEELIPYRAPLLAMLAQVIDVVRWTINTFSTAAALILDMTLDLLTSLLTTYNGVVPGNEKKWLRSKLVRLQPLNLYYFRILWNPPGSNYLEIISGMTIKKNINLDVFATWMMQVLCVCTRQEWCDLYDCLAVFGSPKTLKIFHDTVAKLFIAEKSNNIENAWACMFYVYRLFIYITRFKFLKEPLTDAQVQTAISRVASLSELIKEENVEQFGNGLIPLLAFLTDKQSQYNINLVDCLNEHFSHTKLWPKINGMFSDTE